VTSRITLLGDAPDGPRNADLMVEASDEELYVDATITSATLLDSGRIRVEGKLTCNFAAAFAELDLRLRQHGGGRGGRVGDGYDLVNSSGATPTPFTLVVSGGWRRSSTRATA
jgi:hypothetical protein